MPTKSTAPARPETVLDVVTPGIVLLHLCFEFVRSTDNGYDDLLLDVVNRHPVIGVLTINSGNLQKNGLKFG